MAYLKRQKVPKNWPVKQKGSTYVVKPRFGFEKGIPVLIILRDILKLAENRREARKIIHNQQMLLNNKPIKDDKCNVLLFDVLSIADSNKFYRMNLSKRGKLEISEIGSEEAGRKIAKVIGKKVLKGKKKQLNLSDGRNFFSDLECKRNDSVVVNLFEKKIEKCVPLKEKSKVIVFEGKHAGKSGEVKSIKDSVAEVKIDNKDVNILTKQIMAVE